MRRIIRAIRNIIYEIKKFIQRGKRGWAYSDVWNMDVWFMEIIPQMLQHLKNNHAGHPVYDINDSDENNDGKYKYYLNRMTYLLEEMDEEKCSQKNEYFDEENMKFIDKDAFVTRQEEIDAYRNKCKDEFFKLFSEHFYELWD